jgi:hypothetical protein
MSKKEEVKRYSKTAKYWWGIKKVDGENGFAKETDSSWDEVKDDLIGLALLSSRSIITLPNNAEEYIQAKSASVDMGSDEIEIESRYIGVKCGNKIVKIRLMEKPTADGRDNILVEIETIKE